MTPQHKNNSESGAERPEGARLSFVSKMREWLRNKREEEIATDTREISHTVFYEFQPDETDIRSETEETLYPYPRTVTKDLVLPRIGDTVIVSNPSREAEYALYYVLSHKQNAGELPHIQIDQVVLPTEENRLFAPAVSVYFDMHKETMLQNLDLSDDGDTWTLSTGTRIQRIMPLLASGVDQSDVSDEQLQIEMNRMSGQSKYDSSRAELAKVLKELNRPR